MTSRNSKIGGADKNLDLKQGKVKRYALEERKKAIELYFKYGRHAAPVISGLGYPNYSSLSALVKEYEETGSLHEKTASSRAYKEEEKKAAVEFLESRSATR